MMKKLGILTCVTAFMLALAAAPASATISSLSLLRATTLGFTQASQTDSGPVEADVYEGSVAADGSGSADAPVQTVDGTSTTTAQPLQTQYVYAQPIAASDSTYSIAIENASTAP